MYVIIHTTWPNPTQKLDGISPHVSPTGVAPQLSPAGQAIFRFPQILLSPFKLVKLLDPDASWDKVQLGDVLHWIRQAVGLPCGLIWGAIPLVGGIWVFLLNLEMETQLFQVQVYSSTCLAVMFLICIKSFVLASSYGQTCYIDEYIAKGYFKKYDSLIEQEFDNFIANEIPLGLCKVLEDKNQVLVKDLNRDAIGEGSHRWLSSTMTLKLPHELKHELTAHSCEVVMIERLPSGVFVDPFELQHLVHIGVFTDGAVFGDTNLELPSFRSNQTVVEIHMSIGSQVLSTDEDESEVIIKVPLHARYQPLALGFSMVEFAAPDIFICCSAERDVPKTSCQSMPTNHIPNKKASPVIWEIPCGNKEHAAVVSAVSFGFAIATALLIVSTSLSYMR